MHIINAFLHLTSLGYKKITTVFSDDQQRQQQEQEDESTPLIGPSLTQEYEDFSHSYGAFWLCFQHALVYFGLAVLGFSYLVESWSIVQSLYFSTVLFTTVGYGDLSPDSTIGKLYTILLAFYGIVILGIFIGILGEIIVDLQNKRAEKSRKEVSTSLVTAIKAEASPTTKTTTTTTTNTTNQNNELLLENTRENSRDPTLLKDIMEIVILEAPIVIVLLCLGLVVGYVEKWSVVDSVYWLVITGTTVGFGDYSPSLVSTRIASIFLLPLAVAGLGEFLARVASAYMDRKRRESEREFMSRSLTLCDLDIMDKNRDGEVDKTEFVCYMLVALQKVNQDDVDEILELFNTLDKTQDSALSREDLVSDWRRLRASVLQSTTDNVP